jgi:hypothetical protein
MVILIEEIFQLFVYMLLHSKPRGVTQFVTQMIVLQDFGDIIWLVLPLLRGLNKPIFRL